MRAPRAASAVAVTAALLAASAVAAVPSASPKAETIPPLTFTRSPDFPDPARAVADVEHWYRVEAVNRWVAEVQRQEAAGKLREEQRLEALQRQRDADRADRSSRQHVGPGGVWAALRACENGGSYRSAPGDKFRGAYQFAPSTWRSLGYSGDPAAALPSVQDEAAQRLQERSGWGQWPRCARLLGLR